MDADIAGGGDDLAPASLRGFGNFNASRIGPGNKFFIGKERTCNIARICFYIDLGGITAIKFHTARTSFDGKPFGGNNIIQKNIACISPGQNAFATA